MLNWIRKALTRTVILSTQGKRDKQTEKLQLPPSEKLVFGFVTALIFLALLVSLQIVHMALIHTWNEKLGITITGMVMLIIGFFFGGW